jgi:ribosomal protein S18 acetylase RimI-like enzyme
MVSTVPRVLVRPATDDDLELLVACLKQREYFTNRLKCQGSGAGLLLVALHEGAPVGDVFLEFEPDDEQYERPTADLDGAPLLQHLEVLEDYRNRGIGTKLLRRSEQLLQARGDKRVVLGVNADNDGAIRLYRRLGYTWYPEPGCRTFTDAVVYTWNPDETRTVSGTEKCVLMVKEFSSQKRIPVGAVPIASAGDC